MEGNTKAYRKLRVDFKKAQFEAKAQFFKKNIEGLRTEDPKRWHQEIARLARNGGRRNNNIPPSVPGFESWTDDQMANKIAQGMDDLTKDYKLINSETLRSIFSPFRPERVVFSEVVHAIKTMKLPRSLHKNDPPGQVIKRYAELFATPLTVIFNRCLREARWPRKWKTELTFMIPKRRLVEGLKDLRPIAMTEVWSKLLESVGQKMGAE